jgi:hypothetical protein
MSKKSPKPDCYRLRMRYLHWYLDLYAGTQLIETMGPYGFHEANQAASNLGIPDADRG